MRSPRDLSPEATRRRTCRHEVTRTTTRLARICDYCETVLDAPLPDYLFEED